MTRLNRLASIRASVDSGSADRKETYAYYTGAISALDAADLTEDKAARGDRQLRDDLAALEALAEAKEAGSQEGSLLSGVLAAGSFRGTSYLDFVEARATRFSAMDRFFRLATPAQRDAATAPASASSPRRAATSASSATRWPCSPTAPAHF